MTVEAYSQTASLVGALMILGGYFGLQMGKFNERAYGYLVLNFFGAFLLLLAALVTGQFGFILLEGAWCLITIYGFVKAHRSAS